MIGLAMIALALAYGRSVSLALYHFVIVGLACAVLTFLSASLFPAFDPILQFLVNFGFYTALFLIGHFLGRWLDRDKYDAE
jgi:hypothetical protein